jgi:endonuclease/exonuclease/phosphatase family metal-dependent hydrolase
MTGTIRALTLNFWGEQPPLDRRMEIALDGIRALAPDLIALQEVRVVPDKVPNTAETIASRLGMNWVWAPATAWGGGDEGLAILSRFPIVRSDHAVLPHSVPVETRIVLGATLTTDAGELSAFTTHLNYRLTDGAKREAQVAAVDKFVADWHAAHPTPLPRLLMGDFNAIPDSDEIRFLRGLHTTDGRRTSWQDAFARCHPRDDGWTWARANPYTQKLAWLDRDRRIDYIFVSPLSLDGRATVRSCEVVLDRPAPDGNFASDHFGLVAEVEIVPLR